MLPRWPYPLDHRHDLILLLSLDMHLLAEGTPWRTHLVPIHTVPCMNKCKHRVYVCSGYTLEFALWLQNHTRQPTSKRNQFQSSPWTHLLLSKQPWQHVVHRASEQLCSSNQVEHNMAQYTHTHFDIILLSRLAGEILTKLDPIWGPP